MTFNKSMCKMLHLGHGNSHYQCKPGDVKMEKSRLKTTWDIGEWEAEHEPAMCLLSPESQTYPELHQKKCGQQVKVSDTTLCSGEASPGVLCPDVETSVQERHRTVGSHPEEGHENDPWGQTSLQQGQTERAGAVQPGVYMVPGRLNSGLSLCKGEL